MELKSNAQKWIIGIVIAVVILVTGYILLNQNNAQQANTEISGNTNPNFTSKPATTGTKSGSPTSVTPADEFASGTYTSHGKYISPDGEQTIEVEITVSEGNITNATLSPVDSDLESLRYQQKFNSGLSGLIVGKRLDEAYISGNVNGSSLTADGFNEALDSIIEQAQAS